MRRPFHIEPEELIFKKKRMLLTLRQMARGQGTSKNLWWGKKMNCHYYYSFCCRLEHFCFYAFHFASLCGAKHVFVDSVVDEFGRKAEGDELREIHNWYIDENCPISLDIYFIRSTKINDIYNIQPYLVEDKASSELSEIERWRRRNSHSKKSGRLGRLDKFWWVSIAFRQSIRETFRSSLWRTIATKVGVKKTKIMKT